MPLPDTKQKIIDASLQLFNQYGISNVRLQQIADETGISVGNLAYHFSNKEAITESLIASVMQALEELLKQYGKYPPLKDLDFFFKEYYSLCEKYRFFNYDILEVKRNFPGFFQLLQPLYNKIKLQIERRLELCLQQRFLQKETDIKKMTANVWLMLFFMPAEMQLNGKNDVTEEQYRRRLWDYVSVYFVAKGINEYTAVVAPAFIKK